MREDMRRIRVMVETAERCFKGDVFKPVKGAEFRLSDYLNTYDRQFLNLANVEIADRGKDWKVGERRDFVALSISQITYITPLEDDREA